MFESAVRWVEQSFHARALALAVLAGLLLLAGGCSSRLLFGLANLPSRFSRVGVHRDLLYGADPRQKLDVYALPGVSHRVVVVFWYGGAWSSGAKADYRFVGTALAQHGYVAVLPDYRLYPQVRFPAFIDDGASAVAWAHSHAREFGGDPDRIVLMGHSAGAHMAAMLALEPSYLSHVGVPHQSIAALVGLSGPYALVPDDAELNAIFAPPYTRADWQPLQHASRDAPPSLLLHGLADQRVASIQSQQLHDALVKLDVPVELELYPGFGHARIIAGFAPLARAGAPTLARCLQFIDRVTAAPSSSGSAGAVRANYE